MNVFFYFHHKLAFAEPLLPAIIIRLLRGWVTFPAWKNMDKIHALNFIWVETAV